MKGAGGQQLVCALFSCFKRIFMQEHLSWQVSKEIFWVTFLRTVFDVGLFVYLLFSILKLY